MRHSSRGLFIGVIVAVLAVSLSITGASDQARPSSVSAGAAVSPGLQIGTTAYDLQKHGSMGRQITTRGSDHILNFSWTHKDDLNFPGGRNSRFNAWDPAFGGLSHGFGGIDIGPPTTPPDWSGFPTMDGIDNTGIVAVAISWSVNSPADPERPFVGYNTIPSLADISGSFVPDSVWTSHLTGDATSFLRPKIA